MRLTAGLGDDGCTNACTLPMGAPCLNNSDCAVGEFCQTGCCLPILR